MDVMSVKDPVAFDTSSSIHERDTMIQPERSHKKMPLTEENICEARLCPPSLSTMTLPHSMWFRSLIERWVGVCQHVIKQN